MSARARGGLFGCEGNEKSRAEDYHRAIPATGSGWRFFLRASVNTLTRGPLNEIRNQVQVYLPSEHLGW